MDRSTAERWVTISAVLVAGIYAYRRLTEGTTSALSVNTALGIGGIPAFGAWATAWGFTYLVVAIMASASPGLGGSFAILIAASDFLTNASSVFADVSKQEGTSSSSTTATSGAGGVVGSALGSSGTPGSSSSTTTSAGTLTQSSTTNPLTGDNPQGTSILAATP